VQPRLFQGHTRFVGLGQTPKLGDLLQKLPALVGAVIVNHPLDPREPFVWVGTIDRHHAMRVA
jgi:hypothetical protein